MRRFAAVGRVMLLAIVLVCCDTAADHAVQEPIVAFDTALVCLASATDTIPLKVEVAATQAQRAHGLMERTDLAADAGMLFTYEDPQPPESGFWMFRTRIPLDIAFVGPEGTIRQIDSMAPCGSPDPKWCETYPAGVEFTAAVEVNQGFFAERGVQIGDRLLRATDGGCART